MKLYALCWQDDHEPWGWAALSPPETKGGQVFFWDCAEAVAALEAEVESRVPDYLEEAEHAARRAYEVALTRWKRQKAIIDGGGRLPGVWVHHIGHTSTVVRPEVPPKPELIPPDEDTVKGWVEATLSVQEYDVPAPPTIG